MNSKNEDLINNTIVEIGKAAYQDAVAPSMKTVGNTLNGVVKMFLSPIRALIWGWEKIEKCVTEGLEKRLKNSKSNDLINPDARIAVPTVQALQYSANEDYIREMFLNLLANDMKKNNKTYIHPSYVEIIKQMSPLDAKILNLLSKYQSYIKAINPNIATNKNSNQIYVGAFPQWFIGQPIEGYNLFDISSSLLHLQKFGLIDLMYDRTAGNDGYEDLEGSELLITVLENYKKENPNACLKFTRSVIVVNDYGKAFVKVCL